MKRREWWWTIGILVALAVSFVWMDLVATGGPNVFTYDFRRHTDAGR